MSDKRNIKQYGNPAGGWGALKSVTQSWLQSEKPLKNLRAMLKTNQDKGFDVSIQTYGLFGSQNTDWR